MTVSELINSHIRTILAKTEHHLAKNNVFSYLAVLKTFN